MIDITDAKGNIRPEFMNLTQEEWAALYHQGRLPSGNYSQSGFVDRLGDLALPLEQIPQVNQQRTDMPAPMVPLAMFATIVPPTPLSSDNLGFYGSIGLFAVQNMGVDRVPLFLGIASLAIPLLILLM